MLHHCLAGGQRASLIKTEITPELKVMRCRHTATFLPSTRLYVEGLQPGVENTIAWFIVFSRCACVVCLHFCFLLVRDMKMFGDYTALQRQKTFECRTEKNDFKFFLLSSIGWELKLVF